jgi:hypothetical protein
MDGGWLWQKKSIRERIAIKAMAAHRNGSVLIIGIKEARESYDSHPRNSIHAQKYTVALKRLNEFVLRGVIPKNVFVEGPGLWSTRVSARKMISSDVGVAAQSVCSSPGPMGI